MEKEVGGGKSGEGEERRSLGEEVKMEGEVSPAAQQAVD